MPGGTASQPCPEGLTPARPGPGSVGAADAMVDVDPAGLHAELGEGLALRSEVLPFSRDPGIADLDCGHTSSVPN